MVAAPEHVTLSDQEELALLRSARILPFGPTCFSLLAIFILVRGAISFLPCEAWGASGYLCAGPYLGLVSSRSHTVVAERAIPEGARLTNRRDFLSLRIERFTIDERGYRNGPEMRIDRPKAVLIGSSFSLGMALNDEDIFSARLNQQLGRVIYNASATFDPVLRADRMIETARAVGMKNGWILFEVLNRQPLQFGPPSSGYSLRIIVEQWLKNLLTAAGFTAQDWAPAISLTRRILYPAALTRAATLLNMRLQDGHLLPNPFRYHYSEEQLITGRHVLVYSGDKQFAQNPASPQATADPLIRLRDQLDRQGYHLAVLLLPNAYSVYYPLYRDHPANDASARYMTELTARLSGNKVPVLNLLPTLRDAARSELNSDHMIYYSDDAHWNPLGCAVAANVTAPWLDRLLRGSELRQ
jgi:hypothetical protein